MMGASTGKIITFYSYKGGTGRSMAVANVAWILASNGKKVLVVDWDLEAPGLHRYFYPFLLDKDLTSSEGLVDFVIDFAIEAATPDQGDKPDKDWYKTHTNMLRYAVSLDWQFPGSGTLDLIPAGRQGPSYAEHVNSFNWQNFYERLGGGAFLEAVKDNMRAEYDYILIDSRTGVSDTSGICTVQMPDILVICFTLNYQSIEGAAAVASSAWEQRRDPNFRVFPVPMRVENAEKEKLEQRREFAKTSFALFLNNLPVPDKDQYWGEVEVMYIPYYAYEELVAAFGDKVGQASSVLASAERLAGYLTNGEVRQSSPPAESLRQEILAKYARKPLMVSSDDLIKSAERTIRAMSPDHQTVAREVLTRLMRLSQADEVVEDTLLRMRLSDFDQPAKTLASELIYAGFLLRKGGDKPEDETIELADDSLIRNWDRLKSWVAEDRDFLLWRQRLQVGMADWERSQRDSGGLLNGTLLRIAMDWKADKGDRLNEREKSYVEMSASFSAAQKRNRVLKAFGAAAALFVLLVLLGLGYARMRADQRAKEAASRAVEALKSSMAHIKEGNERIKEGKYYDAIAEFTRAIDAKPDNSDAYYSRGLAYFEILQFDSSVSDFGKVIQLKPDYAEAYTERGRAYRNTGNISLAIEDYNEAINLDPNLARAFSYRSFAYYKQCRYDNALEDCQRAIEIDPKNADGYDSFGSIYMAELDFDQAISQFLKAIKLKPAFAIAYSNLGLAYYWKGDFSQALQYLNRSIELKPNNPDAYVNLGRVYYAKGSNGQAITAFNQAIQLDSRFSDAFLYRAVVYYKKRSYDLAINDLNHAIDLASYSSAIADAYFYRGLAYKKMNDRTNLISNFQRALDLIKEEKCLTQDQIDKQTSVILGELAPAPIVVWYNDPADKPAVSNIAQQLSDQGYFIKSVKLKSGRTDGEVRYFYEEDKDKAARIGTTLDNLLSAYGATSLQLVYRGDRQATVARGTVEVWIPPLTARASEPTK
jgi:tetratricopeptide (TPR) repeat protein/cellulose biosynthesis protein BcsQ